ncbi:MAG: hypothetical protein ACK4P8_11175 [Tabrizicola sp.]
MRAALLLIALATPSWAACPNESEIFSCTIKGKLLQLCHWKGALIYNFGPIEKPELSLAQPVQTVAFTPWPGMGSDIWETVAFPNGGHTYEVWTSVTRDPEATEGLRGGVTVLLGEEQVARLTCDPGTPSQSLDVIHEIKTAIGQCWDYDSRSWQTSCD